MKFVNIRVTETTHKAALAIMKRDGVKLWKAVEVALLAAKPSPRQRRRDSHD